MTTFLTVLAYYLVADAIASLIALYVIRKHGDRIRFALRSFLRVPQPCPCPADHDDYSDDEDAEC
jgi:hypothetical protein